MQHVALFLRFSRKAARRDRLDTSVLVDTLKKRRDTLLKIEGLFSEEFPPDTCTGPGVSYNRSWQCTDTQYSCSVEQTQSRCACRIRFARCCSIPFARRPPSSGACRAT